MSQMVHNVYMNLGKLPQFPKLVYWNCQMVLFFLSELPPHLKQTIKKTNYLVQGAYRSMIG